jgi:hypothetical protein
VTVAEPTGTLAESVLKYPDIIAADTSGYVYIADPYGSDVYKTNHFGSSTNITESSTAGLDGCLTSATGVAVNHDGTLWVTSYGSPDNVCRMSNTGSAAYTLGASSGGFGSSGIISNADAVAAGSATSNGSGNTGGSGSAWVLDFTHADLYNVANSSTTTATETGPFSGGGMTAPVDLAVDGLGYVWVANNASGVGSISEFTPAGSPVTGSKAYQYDLLSSPSALGIDISGNVWVANTGSGNVIEVIGLAAPTQALVSGNPGTRP